VPAPNINVVEISFDALNALLAHVMLKQGQGNKYIGFQYKLVFADSTESSDKNFVDVGIDNDGNVVLVFNETPNKDVMYIRIHDNYWGGDKNLIILKNSNPNTPIMTAGQTYVFAVKFRLIEAQT